MVPPGRQLVDEDVLIGLERVLHRFLLDPEWLGHERLDDPEDDQGQDEGLDDLDQASEGGLSARAAGTGVTWSGSRSGVTGGEYRSSATGGRDRRTPRSVGRRTSRANAVTPARGQGRGVRVGFGVGRADGFDDGRTEAEGRGDGLASSGWLSVGRTPKTGERPVAQPRPADDAADQDRAEGARVGRLLAVVAHDEQLAVGDRPAGPAVLGSGRLGDAADLEEVRLVEGDRR